MTTLNLKVEDSLIDEVVASSIEEVQKRVLEAEAQKGISEEEYENYILEIFKWLNK